MTADLARGRALQAIPWLWLALSLLWATVIVVTDQPGWPLALWIATTVGPLTHLRSSKHRIDPGGSDAGGTHG